MFPSKEMDISTPADRVNALHGISGRFQAIQGGRGIPFYQLPESPFCVHESVNLGLIPLKGEGEEPTAIDQNSEIPASIIKYNIMIMNPKELLLYLGTKKIFIYYNIVRSQIYSMFHVHVISRNL